MKANPGSAAGSPTPVVEAKPCGNTGETVTERALRLRVRQQEILAELGVRALRGTPYPELLEYAVQCTAEGLEAEFCKVMEYVPAENRLLLRAGVGWEPHLVGTASVGADLASPAGFALRTGKPVISNHLENEERFRTPELLVEHGIRRAMNVILQGEGRPYGVLEVDSRSPGEFGEQDIAFLQGVANLLGMAIERQRIERDLRAMVEEREVLLREVNHRVKNSLQLVASMLSLQANATDKPDVRHELREAATRINAIGRAHQRLYRSNDVRVIDLAAYLVDLCADLNAAWPEGEVVARTPDEPVPIATDRAIPLALVVNELVTNATKYAYPGRQDGLVEVCLDQAPEESRVVLAVRDAGVGLPPGFAPHASTGLGMRIVTAFAQQLKAELRIRPLDVGTEFSLVISLQAPDRAG
ncbi:sensor histidine kinase [Benzoatithermus flavus]|uniref:histidine kinase n=1 Tax=Benzoatithermus flavus TaxID=3108223 RepID=A0ABU8XST7_9PROT